MMLGGMLCMLVAGVLIFLARKVTRAATTPIVQLE